MNKKYIVSMIVVMAIAISSLAPVASAFSIGQRGGEIVDLQASLIEAGFDIPAITTGGAPFGYYGVQTDKAYKASLEVKAPILGGVAGPDFFSDYFNVNGVKSFYYSSNMLSTGSTTCSFKTPVATTTILQATANFLNIASTTIPVIGWAAAPMATTTTIGSVSLTSGTQGTVVASSTASTFIVPPNTFINVKIPGGAIAGTTAPSGTCKLILVGV